MLVTEAAAGDAEKETSSSQAPAAVATITGQGTANKVAKFTAANSIGDSALTEAGGRLGVGTPSPQQSIHAVGTTARLRLQSTGGTALTTTEYVTNSKVWQAGAGGSTAANGVANKFFVFDQTAGQFRLVIDTAGNFGIGTTAPTSRLTVNGGIQILGAGNGIKFADGSIQTKATSGTITGTGTTNRLTKFTGPNSFGNSSITEVGGKVGIGTASPNHSLSVIGGPTWTSNGWVGSVELPNAAAIGWRTNGQWNFGMGHSGGGLYFFRTASAPGATTAAAIYDLSISDNGTVGIGTIAPAQYAKLVIIGDSSTSQGAHSENSAGTGLYGFGQTGVEGQASAGGTGISGVAANSNDKDKAVSGETTLNAATGSYYGYAGYFVGNVRVFGKLEVAQGCVGCSPPSDRNLKANFSTVNPRSILDRLSTLPIQTWNYKFEPETVRHMGAMAQDFRAAFNLGADDHTLNTVDAQGVTMASVQALYQLILEKDRQNQELSRKVERLQAQVAQQHTQLDQVRRTIRRRAAKRSP